MAVYHYTTHYWSRSKAGWTLTERQGKRTILTEEVRWAPGNSQEKTHIITNIQSGMSKTFISRCGYDRDVVLVKILEQVAAA